MSFREYAEHDPVNTGTSVSRTIPSTRPCKHGHVCDRYVVDGKCVECVKVKDRKASKKYQATAKGKLTTARATAKYLGTARGRAKRLEFAQKYRANAEIRAGRALYEHRRGLRRNYGIDETGYEQLLVAQKGRCAICHSAQPVGKRRLCVDHDHATGRIRGLLCSNCNSGLGQFADSKIHLRSAIAYLCSKTT